MNHNKCLEIEPLLPGFVLGLLSAEEEAEVETHIADCPSCRQSLQDFQVIEEGLLLSGPTLNPPSRIRSYLLNNITPKSRHERSKGIFVPTWAVASGLAAIILLIFLNLNMLRNINQIVDAQTALQEQNLAYQTTLALLSSPHTQVAVIDQENLFGTLVYDPDGETAVLNIQGLDSLPSGKAYQAWLIQPDNSRVSAGIFQARESSGFTTLVIQSPIPINSYTGLGVTVEPAGGSPGPTGPKILGTEL